MTRTWLALCFFALAAPAHAQAPTAPPAPADAGAGSVTAPDPSSDSDSVTDADSVTAADPVADSDSDAASVSGSDADLVSDSNAASVSDSVRPEAAARASLELPLDAKVVLYAGNLDGYQGWEEAADAARRANATFLVATESDPAPLAPFPHLRARLGDEHDRRRAYAACDLAIVPRRAPGGLPIKLLDALARDVPVVAGPRALAGLDPRGVERADTDEAPALAVAIERALASAPRGGRAWIEDSLAPARFVASVAELARGA